MLCLVLQRYCPGNGPPPSLTKSPRQVHSVSTYLHPHPVSQFLYCVFFISFVSGHIISRNVGFSRAWPASLHGPCSPPILEPDTGRKPRHPICPDRIRRSISLVPPLPSQPDTGPRPFRLRPVWPLLVPLGVLDISQRPHQRPGIPRYPCRPNPPEPFSIAGLSSRHPDPHRRDHILCEHRPSKPRFGAGSHQRRRAEAHRSGLRSGVSHAQPRLRRHNGYRRRSGTHKRRQPKPRSRPAARVPARGLEMPLSQHRVAPGRGETGFCVRGPLPAAWDRQRQEQRFGLVQFDRRRVAGRQVAAGTLAARRQFREWGAEAIAPGVASRYKFRIVRSEKWQYNVTIGTFKSMLHILRVSQINSLLFLVSPDATQEKLLAQVTCVITIINHHH